MRYTDPRQNNAVDYAYAKEYGEGAERNGLPDPCHEAFPILRDVFIEMKKQKDRWGEQNHRNFPRFTNESESDDLRERMSYQMGVPSAKAARFQCEARFSHQHRGSWADILIEEVSEAVEEYGNPDALRKELVQCAAVITSWIEAMDRSKTFDVIETDEDTVSKFLEGSYNTVILRGHLTYTDQVMIRNRKCHRDMVVLEVGLVKHTASDEVAFEELIAAGFQNRDEFEREMLEGHSSEEAISLTVLSLRV